MNSQRMTEFRDWLRWCAMALAGGTVCVVAAWWAVT